VPSRPALSVFILLSLLAACATPVDPVQVEHDPGFDASGWRGFTWRERSYEEGMTRDSNPRLERLVRDAAARELAAKGYREVPAAEADFAVAYGAAARVSYRVDPRTGGTLSSSVPDSAAPSYTVREGTLALQVIDAGLDRTVWIGSTQATVLGPPPEGRDEAVRAAVVRILGRFPDAAR
jgi:hypothetical protein